MTRLSNSGNDLRAFMGELDEIGELRADQRRRLESGDRRAHRDRRRAERAGAAVRRDQGLSEGLPHPLQRLRRPEAHRHDARAAARAFRRGAAQCLARRSCATSSRCRRRPSTSGPVLDNVLEGDDVDLEQFPTPLWHEKDGGRYIGTGDAVITRDPETGAVNVGTYRCMIQGRNRISVKMNKGKHGRLAMQKYHAMGKPCPIAVSVGHAPQLFMAAQLPMPLGVEEYGVAGWLARRAGRGDRVAPRAGCRCRPSARSCSKARCCPTRTASRRRKARSANGRAITPTPPSAKCR